MNFISRTSICPATKILYIHQNVLTFVILIQKRIHILSPLRSFGNICLGLKGPLQDLIHDGCA